jgi:leader peptidase (prepilin peptidase) / N-methyltransferase
MPESDSLAETAAFLWPAVALALGFIVGSFANVCIHRLPLGESIVSPRSRCPSCRAPIAALDNVPVLSFLVLGGRCRHCRVRISWRYPAVEAANGLLYLAVALRDGLSPRALVDMVLITTLLVLSLIDLDHLILPNVITLPGIVFGFAASFLPGSPVDPLDSAKGAVGGYLAFAAVAWAYERVRRQEGLGQGDWKLAAMLGAFLGWKKLLATAFLASLAGSLIGGALILLGRRDASQKIPLGTYLGVAGILCLFWGSDLIDWYRMFLHR